MARKRLGSRMAGIALSWPGKPREPRDALVDDSALELCERAGEDEDNLIVLGDNLMAMQALEARLSEQIALCYIDPPYATGLSYYTLTSVGEDGDAVERRAYRDHHGGMAGYLTHMYERLSMIRRLLAPHGHLFLHCDWRANSALRLVLDEIFGGECFRNEIVWRRAPNLGRQAASSQLGRVVDSILVYSKTAGAPFPGPVPRRRARVALDTKGKPKGARWDDERSSYFTTAPRGDYTDDSIAELRKQGRIYDSSTGKVYVKYFLTEGEDGRWYKEQPVDTIWDDFAVRPLRHRPKSEDMGYDTQKPEGLLERIIGWASRPGDVVADFYGGSGTTAAVAQRLGRRFVSCDIGRAAVAIARRRLLDAGASFAIYSLLGAERKAWAEQVDAVAEVLRARGAEPLGDRWGRLDDALLCVLDTAGEREVATACKEARSRGARALEVLAWSWEDAELRALGERHGIALTLRTIPMELSRGERQVTFAERAEVDLSWQGKRLRLERVRCPGNDDVRAWADLVDAWMVDARGGRCPDWRSYRTHGDRELELQTPPLELCGERVRVVVLTVFGDEIARTLSVP